MNASHRKKGSPEVGMLVVKIGGPAYRIGIGNEEGKERRGSSRSKKKERRSKEDMKWRSTKQEEARRGGTRRSKKQEALVRGTTSKVCPTFRQKEHSSFPLFPYLVFFLTL